MPSAKRVRRTRLQQKTSPEFLVLLEELGRESDANQMVYLATISRVLPEVMAATDLRDITSIDRQELLDMVRDSLDNPIAPVRGGRPRVDTGSRIEKIVVFKEAHADGSPHYHVAVKLTRAMRFELAKATLRNRHKLASHWSCTHTAFWSAVRHGTVATPKKPVVDAHPVSWPIGLDLFEESNESFMESAWTKRREKADLAAAVGESKSHPFNKLDFTALVLAKHLHTKAAVLTYVQERGTNAMQLYVCKHQDRLGKCLVTVCLLVGVLVVSGLLGVRGPFSKRS